MQYHEPGVLPQSDYYFATPSAQAKSLFYYLLYAGDFVCTNAYHVKRDSFSSYLLMYVTDGECSVKYHGNIYKAKKNDMILIDCSEPHEYFTNSSLNIIWLHFEGSNSSSFYEQIIKKRGFVFECPNPQLYYNSLKSILNILKNDYGTSEAKVSSIIYSLLCNMVSSDCINGNIFTEESILDKALKYIRDNIENKIYVSDISKQLSMSPSNLSRIFNKELGCSPYEYIINVRIDLAKKLLKTTHFSLEEIAQSTGFSSSANFITAFSSRVGMTPNSFRNMPF